MAIHANSTPAPERTLLRETAAPGRLLSASQPSLAQRADLLTVLAMAPDMIEVARLRRPAMGNAIHALIEAMDALDIDPDLEDDGCAEPYVGRCETGAGEQPTFDGGGGDECEDCGDDEPSLGAPDHMMLFRHGWGYVDRTCDQTHWAKGGRNDLEEVNEDGGDILDEPHDQEADEPSLGAAENHHDQTQWPRGGFNDLELDKSDHEPSLGSLHDIDQQLWAHGHGAADREMDELQPCVGA